MFVKIRFWETCPILLIVFYCVDSFSGLLAVTPLHIFYMINLIELCKLLLGIVFDARTPVFNVKKYMY